MELSLLLAEQIVSLFLYVAVGYVCMKIALFKVEDSKIVSNIVVYVCNPCMIIYSFQIELTPDKMKGLLIAVIAAIIAHILMIAGTRVIGDVTKLNSIERASLTYTNAGNLIIPLVAAVLGPEYVFYTVAYNVTQTVLMWTHMVSLLADGEKKSLKEILFSANIVAVIIGFILFVLKFHIPTIVNTCLEGLGTMIGPLGMFVLGMVLGNVDFKHVFRQKKPYFICLARLILYPAVSAVLCAMAVRAGIHPDAERVLLVVFLATAAPVAVMVTQICQIYDKDSKYASAINVMSIIFCIVTMPAMTMFYEMLV